jgi:hypothetical protein
MITKANIHKVKMHGTDNSKLALNHNQTVTESKTRRAMTSNKNQTWLATTLLYFG